MKPQKMFGQSYVKMKEFGGEAYQIPPVNDSNGISKTIETSKQIATEFHRLHEEILRLQHMLKMAYCQKIGTDTPHGLDSCDNYKDWLQSLEEGGH